MGVIGEVVGRVRSAGCSSQLITLLLPANLSDAEFAAGWAEC